MEGCFLEERRETTVSTQMPLGKMPSFTRILHIFPLERLYSIRKIHGEERGKEDDENLCKYFLVEYGILRRNTSQKCTASL